MYTNIYVRTQCRGIWNIWFSAFLFVYDCAATEPRYRLVYVYTKPVAKWLASKNEHSEKYGSPHANTKIIIIYTSSSLWRVKEKSKKGFMARYLRRARACDVCLCVCGMQNCLLYVYLHKRNARERARSGAVYRTRSPDVCFFFFFWVYIFINMMCERCGDDGENAPIW